MKKMFFTGSFTVLFCAAVFSATVDGIVGFATQNGGTTGGAGGEVVTVTNLADFITAVRDSDPTPRTVYINAAELNSGDDKGRQVKLGSNKTIIGCGSGTFMNGILLGINGKSNIIIRNLRFSMTSITNTTDPAVYDPDGDEGRPQIIVNGGDCISIQGSSSNIWIDHCEFSQVDPAVQTNQDLYDGLIDVKNTSEYITISWSYFHDHHKTHLVGSSDSDNYDRKITFHHNYYKNISERLPSYRFGTGHVFNNYYLDAHSSGVNSRMGACLRVESNYFEASQDPIISKNSSAVGYWDLRNSTNGTDNSNIYSGCSGSQPTTSNCAFTPPYEYASFLDAAANVKAVVLANVGVGKINPGCGTVNTPTRTPSLPAATNTRTRTATPSATRTSTAVPTATNSVLPSSTVTPTGTRTVTSTPTRSATASVSPQHTFTNTPTRTLTFTPSMTRTATQTGTLTPYPLMPTATATATRTVTAVPPTVTFTVTVSGTATRTRTRTVTPSFSRTATQTGTLTPYPLIPTFTATATRTGTVLPPTASFTHTLTLTLTSSLTATRTITAVPSATATFENPTATSTASPAGTFTVTPANSATRTATLISSPSMTATLTNTMVSSPSFTATLTWTPSVTPSLTLTVTRTPTPVPSFTATRHTLTATPSLTPIPLSPTATATRTATQLPGDFTIDPVVYPNPYRPSAGDLKIALNMSRPADRVLVRIYSASFRKVFEQDFGSAAADRLIGLQARYLAKMGSGAYYIEVRAEERNNIRKIVSAIQILK